MATFDPITINIPIEIDAGSFATSTTVQGETVSYSKVHLPLMYYTEEADPTVAQMRQTFLFKEGADQTEVTVDISGGAIGSFANGTAVVKALFKAALEAADLRSEAMTAGAIYADGTARNTESDPLKFYVSKDEHTAGTSVGSTLKAYLQEYLYDNLSKIIGLAATTGSIDITMSRDGSAASEIIAETLATQLCGTGNTEQNVAAAALRQNIYEQMFTLAPERFTESTLMNRDPAGNITYQELPFQLNDTMAFLVTFKFPASQISAPVVGNAIRTNNGSVYVDTGSKISVVAGTDATSSVRPQLSDFPDATVMMRVKLTDGAGAPAPAPGPTGTEWVQRGADIDGEAGGDYSSQPISLSSDGSIVAIGAYYNNGNGSFSGHVRVYAWNGSAWVQRGADIDGEAAGDQSGTSVSLSSDGSVVAIGAPNNDGNGSNAGHVRVYAWNGSAWVQRGADIDGEAASDNSGSSVSLSADGSVVAIGASYNSGNGYMKGHVRVYAWNGSAWVQRGADMNGEATSNYSGSSVSLSSDGTVVAIGAYGNDGNGSDAGHVRVYAWNGSAWVQRGADMDGEAAGDNSGWSVSLSGDGSIVAIGAYQNDGNGSNAGHARVYAWNGSAWVQRGADIDGEAAIDFSGISVSLSSDGTIVAIGANGNDGNGDNAGHVRVYAWNGSAWIQRGADMDGEVAGDRSGSSVSLSGDGSTVAIGANQNDGNGSNAGHVRIYEFV